MGIVVDETNIHGVNGGPGIRYAVARCSECPYWSVMRDTASEALSAAVDHETRVHPGREAARRRRDRARPRD